MRTANNSYRLFRLFQRPGLVLLIVAMSTAGLFAQCPMCVGTVESLENVSTSPIAKGLNTGIMMLFVLPYIIIATVGYLWYKNYKQKVERDKNGE